MLCPQCLIPETTILQQEIWLNQQKVSRSNRFYCAPEWPSSQSVCPGVLMAFLLSHSVQEETQAFPVTWLSPSCFLLTLFVKQKPLPVRSHPLIPLLPVLTQTKCFLGLCRPGISLHGSTWASSRRPLSLPTRLFFLYCIFCHLVAPLSAMDDWIYLWVSAFLPWLYAWAMLFVFLM